MIHDELVQLSMAAIRLNDALVNDGLDKASEVECRWGG
jgi:hypothetical protein